MTFKLASIGSDQGAAAALVVGDRVVEIASATGAEQDRSMLALISNWPMSLPRLQEIAARADKLGKPLESVKLLAPIANPGGIYCAGSNYSDHAAEMSARAGKALPPDPRTLGLRSWHFLKTMHCVSGHDDAVPMHPRGKKIDWEAELAVVIGKKAFQVSEEDAFDYVLGYTIANDLSARDLARRDALPDSSMFKPDWLAHKVWDGSCPLGPWITLAGDIPDPHSLTITLDVNGVIKQDSNSGEMIFNINEQIADLSRNCTLWPGDIILTGTPAGVGAGRGEFLRKGDVVRIRIERLGELIHSMA
jgi:2-keto-4-pentenoate hydratase/2-oxohepta-3-ene-1,7-dioic acid hydratase in catechol pathway